MSCKIYNLYETELVMGYYVSEFKYKQGLMMMLIWISLRQDSWPVFIHKINYKNESVTLHILRDLTTSPLRNQARNIKS